MISKVKNGQTGSLKKLALSARHNGHVTPNRNWTVSREYASSFRFSLWRQRLVGCAFLDLVHQPLAGFSEAVFATFAAKEF